MFGPRLRFFALALSLACSDSAPDPLGDAGGADAGCRGPADCPTGERCGPEGACAACFEDEHCAASESCEQGRCVPRSCTGPEDCPEGLGCEAGQCTEPVACGPDMSCPGGLVCQEDGICGPCPSDWACETAEICAMGRCEPGTPCNRSADCPSDRRCSRGLCRTPCAGNADCGPPAGLFVCDASAGECRQRCTASSQCPAGQFCGGNQCRPSECAMDEDCPMGQRCRDGATGRGRCEAFQLCDRNEDCPPGRTCDPAIGECVDAQGCRTDRDCPGNAYCDPAGQCQFALSCVDASCPSGFDCVGGRCVPAVCRGDEDCPAGELCQGGVCAPPASARSVTEIQILGPAVAVRPGGRVSFVALALDQTGRAVPGIRFDWTSSSTVVASMDPNGIATGGTRAGATVVRAAVEGSLGRVESNPVDLVNLGPAPTDTVVRVVNRGTGRPIPGATVELSYQRRLETEITDARGEARFPGFVDRPARLTVASEDHDWVTLTAVETIDIGVGLAPRSLPDEASGVSGSIDLSQASTQGALEIGVAGTSIPSPLFGFDPTTLFGGELFQVQVPMVGPVPVPANNTLSVEVFGTNLPLKTTFYAGAEPGLRSVWAFGGRVDLSGAGIGLGDLGNIATAVLPFFQRFDHAVLPIRTLLAVPRVPDANDLNGNGNRTELRPDWDGLPSVRLAPSAAQSLRYELRVGPLPAVAGGDANTLIVLAGVVLPGVGFVPLGIDGEREEMGSGVVETFLTRMAPPYGGLEAGRYAVLATAVRAAAAGLPGPGSARLFVGRRLPTTVDLSSGWLPAPTGATWDQATRAAQIPATGDAARLRFESATGAWDIYGPTGGTLTVPPAPAGFEDRAGARLALDVLRFEAGAPRIGLQFDAVGGAPVGLDAVTDGFARAVLGGP